MSFTGWGFSKMASLLAIPGNTARRRWTSTIASPAAEGLVDPGASSETP